VNKLWTVVQLQQFFQRFVNIQGIVYKFVYNKSVFDNNKSVKTRKNTIICE